MDIGSRVAEDGAVDGTLMAFSFFFFFFTSPISGLNLFGCSGYFELLIEGGRRGLVLLILYVSGKVRVSE